MKRSAFVVFAVLTLSAFTLALLQEPQVAGKEPADGKKPETARKKQAGEKESTKEGEGKTEEGAKEDPQAGKEGENPAAKREKKKNPREATGEEGQPAPAAEKKEPGKKEPAKKDPSVPGKEGENPAAKRDPRKTPKESPKEGVGEPGKPVPGAVKEPPIPGRRPIPVPVRPGKETPKNQPKVDEEAPVAGLPEDFTDQQRAIYRRLEEPELTFEEHLRFAKLEFARLRALEKNPALRYQPGRGKSASTNTACGNGGFEEAGGSLDAAEWSGGNGSLANPNFTSGLFPGAITDVNAHQTLVTTSAQDPNVGINMTGPNTLINQPVSGNAVRIGNAVNGARAELLSKTFTVTSAEALIHFWYAVVFQDPGHGLGANPSFQVRVLDNTSGTPVVQPGLANLGNGSDVVIADQANPFFQVKAGGTPIVYKDWSCAQINLSTLIGKSVTIEFVTKDCALGGHWGYAYIDDVCGTCKGSPTGDLQFDAADSTTCGKGKLCFNYTLPHAANAAGNVTGTAVITLDIYQNGTQITLTPPLDSGTLNSGTSYCFNIDPANIPGLDPAAGGFDFVASGTFTLGTNVQTMTVGTVPDGRVAGPNNDYKIVCDGTQVADACCLGKNLVPNGTFDPDGVKPHSEYHPAEGGKIENLVPGSYILTKPGEIGKACSNWALPAACAGTNDFSGYVMVVNGLTSQPAGSTSIIYDQHLDLPKPPTGEKAEYRICFRYLPLPQCCFNIQAKPSVVVQGKGGPIPLTNVSDTDTGCGHQFAATFQAPAGSVNLQIILPSDGQGDGNDLMISNVSVAQLVKVPLAALLFTYMAMPGTGNTYDVALTAPAGLTNPPYTWVWELWPPGATSASQTIGGNVPTTTFTGLAASTSYVFKLKAWSDCNSLSGSKQTWSFDPTVPKPKKAQAKPVEDPNPEPVTLAEEPAEEKEEVKTEQKSEEKDEKSAEKEEK